MHPIKTGRSPAAPERSESVRLDFRESTQSKLRTPDGERGSALVLAIFVLVLLAGTGIVLMNLAQNEANMGRANIQTKAAFYLAEAGLEDGRGTLLSNYGTTDLTASLTTAAGLNGQFDFSPEKLVVVYDASGNPTGFTGYGDDVPLRGPTVLGDGIYASFLTNDPQELQNGDSSDDLTDGNYLVTISGVGAGKGSSLEVVSAMVEPEQLLPSIPPCTIMMLGPDPAFYGGDGTCDDETGDEYDDADESTEIYTDKTFWGDDCAGSGGTPGYFVPVICVEGCNEYDTAEDEDALEEATDEGLPNPFDELEDEGIDGICNDSSIEIATGPCSNLYRSDVYRTWDTVADYNDPLVEPTMGATWDAAFDRGWKSCSNLQSMLSAASAMADSSCSGGTCSLPAGAGWSGASPSSSTTSDIIYVDGDLAIDNGVAGAGMLFVTGTLSMHANASWDGPIVIVGEGSFVRTGTAGAGVLSGATVLANIAGADGVYGTLDDCSGAHGGFGVASYTEAADATGDTMYCSDDLGANPVRTYELQSFKQH